MMEAWEASGNWPEEWLPQMTTFLIWLTDMLVFSASWKVARFWSNLVMAEKFSLGMEGAKWAQTAALVLAGLATTRTLTLFLAYLSKALPCSMKILELAAKRSLLVIPALNGDDPTRKATSTPCESTQGHFSTQGLL